MGRDGGQHRLESPFAERGAAFAATLAADPAYAGEVDARKVTRTLYASNASICMVMPAAVAVPAGAEDVVRIVRAAAAHGVPVTPRGAGSSVAGQSLGEGVILDFAPRMNRLVALDAAERVVRVEPGMIRNRLDEALQPSGLWFPPNPSSGGFCTLGGMIATNSGGSHSLKYGTTRHYVRELKLVLADGSRCTVRASQTTRADVAETERARALAEQVRGILAEHRAALAAERPRSLRNSCGYNLFEAETPEGLVDLTRILCGSEGTLGIIVEATLALLPRPTQKRGVMLAFAEEQAAFAAVQPLVEAYGPATVQCLPRDLLALARDHGELADEDGWLSPELATLLLVEFDGTDAEADAVEAAAQRCASELGPPHGPAYRTDVAHTPAALDALWRVRRSAAALLWRLPGSERPTRWIEDGAVPPEKLPEFVAGLRELFAAHGLDAALFGHAGQGLLHFSPRVDPHAPGFTEQLAALGEAHAELVRALGGVVSGEHGDGLLRTPYLRRNFPRSYAAFEATKRIFDPAWRLNPLVIVPEPSRRGYGLSAFLRYDEAYGATAAPTESALDTPLVQRAVEACHGCGSCRQYCPVVALGDEEAHLPRAKANVVRGLVAGTLTVAEAFEGDDGRAVVDHCLSCGLCLSECPSRVDIPGISALFHEARRHYHGGADPAASRLGEWLLRPDWLIRLGNLAPPVANTLLGLRPLRKGMQRLTGVAADAPLPRFGRSRDWPHRRTAAAVRTSPAEPRYGGEAPAEARAQHRQLVPGSLAPPGRLTLRDGQVLREAAIFMPCDARGADDETPAHLAELLDALGVTPLRLSEAQGVPCCGRPLQSRGHLHEAAQLASVHRHWLREHGAHPGRVVVVPSVSCLAPLREQAAALGVALYDACELLNELLPQVALPALPQDTGPVTVHVPCSARACGLGGTAATTLGHMGFSSVMARQGNCCGALGTFSLMAKNRDAAVEIGAAMTHEIGHMPTWSVVSTSDNCCRWLMFRLSMSVCHPATVIVRTLQGVCPTFDPGSAV